MWMRTARAVRPLTAIFCVARLPALSRRPFSVLLKDNPYLPQLLASNGLSEFSNSAQTGHPDPSSQAAKYTFSFAINRQAVQPSCQITVETQSEFLDLPEFHCPPFSPSAKATEISNIDPRVKAVADVLWKSFCVNDFLNLDVTGLLHPDGSWSFEQCQAVVDESAVHRQGELFKHVTRYEYPEEIEAEKSLLVYRRYHIPHFQRPTSRMDPPGPIGTVVNGAGLAMSTCDTIELLNGRSANFLDAGGKATPATIKEAFRLVLKNPEVHNTLRFEANSR
jgi:hypothetical protein